MTGREMKVKQLAINLLKTDVSKHLYHEDAYDSESFYKRVPTFNKMLEEKYITDEFVTRITNHIFNKVQTEKMPNSMANEYTRKYIISQLKQAIKPHFNIMYKNEFVNNPKYHIKVNGNRFKPTSIEYYLASMDIEHMGNNQIKYYTFKDDKEMREFVSFAKKKLSLDTKERTEYETLIKILVATASYELMGAMVLNDLGGELPEVSKQLMTFSGTEKLFLYSFKNLARGQEFNAMQRTLNDEYIKIRDLFIEYKNTSDGDTNSYETIVSYLKSNLQNIIEGDNKYYYSDVYPSVHLIHYSGIELLGAIIFKEQSLKMKNALTEYGTKYSKELKNTPNISTMKTGFDEFVLPVLRETLNDVDKIFFEKNNSPTLKSMIYNQTVTKYPSLKKEPVITAFGYCELRYTYLVNKKVFAKYVDKFNKDVKTLVSDREEVVTVNKEMVTRMNRAKMLYAFPNNREILSENNVHLDYDEKELKITLATKSSDGNMFMFMMTPAVFIATDNRRQEVIVQVMAKQIDKESNFFKVNDLSKLLEKVLSESRLKQSMSKQQIQIVYNTINKVYNQQFRNLSVL